MTIWWDVTHSLTWTPVVTFSSLSPVANMWMSQWGAPHQAPAKYNTLLPHQLYWNKPNSFIPTSSRATAALLSNGRGGQAAHGLQSLLEKRSANPCPIPFIKLMLFYIYSVFDFKTALLLKKKHVSKYSCDYKHM
jgi:hypothetical protein